MVSQKQIAEAVGVSVCTVSKILAGGAGAKRYSAERRAAVETAAQRLGYRRNYHAAALRSSRSLAIGLLLLTGEAAAAAQVEQLLPAIDQRLRGSGLHTLVISGASALEDALRFAAERRIGGLMVYGPTLQKTQRRPLTALSIPVLLINAPWADDLPQVCIDGTAAMEKAVDYVAGRDRRVIRYLGWRDPLQASSIERAQAVKEAAAARGIAADEWTTHVEGQEDTIDAAYAAVRLAALTDQQPDAIICYDDAHALGAMYACRDSGLQINRDVDIVGFGNTLSRYARPAICSVSAMAEEIAAHAVDRLLLYQQDQDACIAARGQQQRIVPVLSMRH